MDISEGPDFVTPRISDKDRLYEYFKEDNWWARHPNAWMVALIVYLLLLLCFGVGMVHGVVSNDVVLYTALGFIPFLATLALVKYVSHDRPLNKFMRKWYTHNDDKWSTNIGGILKEYY